MVLYASRWKWRGRIGCITWCTRRKNILYRYLGQKNVQEEKTFYTDIWGRKMEHNKDATWLREIKKYMNGKNKQTRVQISHKKLKKLFKKIPNWKAPGPDQVLGFWLKSFTSLHKSIVWHLNVCLEVKKPRWMTKEITVLIQKDKSKENKASNYCPTTCLT